MSNQPMDEILRNKIDRLHRKELDKKLPQAYAKTVLNSLPETEIMTSNTAIKYVKQNSPLDDDNLIINGINTCIDSKDLISTESWRKIVYKKE